MTELDAAAEGDLALIRLLLEQAGLPTSDLVTSGPQFKVLREDGRVVAAGALQRFGSTALVRSVVVVGERRGIGLGQVIVQELENEARASGIGRLILLTQTAVEFFAHLGYRIIERSDAPEDLRGSEEFRSLCPSSASCMMKVLNEFP